MAKKTAKTTNRKGSSKKAAQARKAKGGGKMSQLDEAVLRECRKKGKESRSRRSTGASSR